MRRIVRHPLFQAGLARLLGWYLGFALGTTRWRLDGVEHVAPHAAGQPAVVAFWHERLALMPALWGLVCRMPSAKPGRVHVLVSQHHDGRFIGAVVRRFGVSVVLGSSTRGGAAATRRLVRLLKDGSNVLITPDGPRGPPRVAAPGAAQIAALSGVPVLPCAAQVSKRWVLNSWDRMVVPKPFGRGFVVCGPPIPIARDGWENAAGTIAAALSAAVDEADRLCGT